jgi:hypothetical protein
VSRADANEVTMLVRAALPQYVVTHEYPGVIAVQLDDKLRWCFGTVNETWGGDLIDHEDNELKHISLEVHSTESFADVCAHAIVDFIGGDVDRRAELERCLRELRCCVGFLNEEGTTCVEQRLSNILGDTADELETYLA